MNVNTSIDVSENEILNYGEELLSILLFDRTTRRNIIWGTSDYEDRGPEYNAKLPIEVSLITGKNKDVIQPRIYKEKTNQFDRTKTKAEVFTPSWMCNKQNNLVDKAWFGKEDVFNTQSNKQWISTTKPIVFPPQKGKGWTDYVDAKRLEISCGEAPYLASRYDTVTGEAIPVNSRIGLLDRKMRVVSENTTDYDEWLEWSKRAFESIYGFEYQGDNLLLARENLLYTFIDYYEDRFKEKPSFEELKPIAFIVSWNIWQMDGLKNAVPFAVITEQYRQMDITDLLNQDEAKPCLCRIRDWRSKETVTFDSLLKER